MRSSLKTTLAALAAAVFAVPVWATGEVISINFNSAGGRAVATDATNVGLAQVPGSAWVNTTGARNETSVVLSTCWDGEKVAQLPSAAVLTFKSDTTWQWDNATDTFLKGYLDDGAPGVSISLAGVPFTSYDVIVYCATDSESRKFQPVSVNGKSYTAPESGNTAKEGLVTFGASQGQTAAYATPTTGNALRIVGCSDALLRIQGTPKGDGGTAPRGGIAALQIVNTGALRDNYSRTLSGSEETWNVGESASNWGDGVAQPTNGSNVTLNVPSATTLTMNATATLGALSVSGDGTLTFATDGGEGYTLSSVSITVNADVDATSGVASLGAVAIDAGKTLTVSTPSQVGSVSAGSGDKSAVVRYVGALTGALSSTPNCVTELAPESSSSGLALTPAGGTLCVAKGNYEGVSLAYNGTATTFAFEDGSLNFGAEGEFSFGTATVSISGGTYNAERLVTVQGAGGRSSVITQTGGDIVLSGTGSATGTQTATLMLGHWPNATSVYHLNGGSLVAAQGGFRLGNDSPSTMNVAGGTLRVKGINGKGTTDSALNVSDGLVEIGADGFANVSRLTVTLSGGELSAFDTATFAKAMSVTGPVTLSAATDKTLTVSGALSGEGALTVGSEGKTGMVSLTGNLSGFTGTLSVTAGTLDVSRATLGETEPTFAFAEGSTGTLILPAGKEGTLSVPHGATLKLTLTPDQRERGYKAENVTVADGGTLKFCDAAGTELMTAGADKTFTLNNEWTATTPEATGSSVYLWSTAANWSFDKVPDPSVATREVHVTLAEGQTLLVEAALAGLPVRLSGTGTVVFTNLDALPTFVGVDAGITVQFAEEAMDSAAQTETTAATALEEVLKAANGTKTVNLSISEGAALEGAFEVWVNGAQCAVTREGNALTASVPTGAYAGKKWRWDYEFSGTSDENAYANGGYNTTALTIDRSVFDRMRMGELAANKTLRLYSRPYRNASFGTAFTAVMRCKVGPYANMTQLAFGTNGDPNGDTKKTAIILATGENPETDMGLYLWQKRTNPGTLTPLASFKVPNATSEYHIYAFSLEVVEGKTQVKVYVDGKLKTTYYAESTITLGDGFQIAAVFGGDVAGLSRYDSKANHPAGDLDFLRTTNSTLSPEAILAISQAYPYVSSNGTATRIVAADGSWVGEGEEKPWTQKLPDAADAPKASPNAGTEVSLTTEGENAVALRLNLPGNVTYESMTVSGSAPLTLKKDADSTAVMTVTDLTVQTHLTLPVGTLDIGTLMVSDGKTLTFDLSGVNFNSIWETRTIPLTGLAQLGTGASVRLSDFDAAAIAPRTAELVLNEKTGAYSLVIAVPEGGLTATVDGAKAWSALAWTFGGTPVTPVWATLSNASVTLRLAEGTSAATVTYDVTDASLPNLGSLTIGEGVTLDTPATARRNFVPEAVTNHGEMIVRETLSVDQVPAYPGKVEFTALTVTGQQVGSKPDELLIREGDTVSFTGNDQPRYAAPKITMTGGALNLATGNTAFWLGANTTVEQRGGTVTMVPESDTASGSGNGLLLGYSGGTTYNLSGGTLDVSKNFLNYWSSSSMNVSGTGVLRMKGAFKGETTAGTLTLADSGRIEITGSQGLPADAFSTLTLNGGTLAATADTTVAANAALGGNVTLEPAANTTVTVSGVLSGDTGALTVAGAGKVTLSGANTYGYGTVVKAGGTLEVAGVSETAQPLRAYSTVAVEQGGTVELSRGFGWLTMTGSGSVNVTGNFIFGLWDGAKIGMPTTVEAGARLSIHNYVSAGVPLSLPNLAVAGTIADYNNGYSASLAITGSLSGTGTIEVPLTLAEGATLDATAGAVTVTGALTLPTEGTVSVTLPEDAATDGTFYLLKCATADATAENAAKFSVPAGFTVRPVTEGTAGFVLAAPSPASAETYGAAALQTLSAFAREQGVSDGFTVQVASKGATVADAAKANAALECFTGLTLTANEAKDTVTVAYDFGIRSLTIRSLTVGEATEPALYVVLAAKVRGADAQAAADYADDTEVKVYRVGRTVSAEGVASETLTEIEGQAPVDSETSEPGVRWIRFPYANLGDMGTFYLKVKATKGSGATP